jgi:hypothetical protein
MRIHTTLPDYKKRDLERASERLRARSQSECVAKLVLLALYVLEDDSTLSEAEIEVFSRWKQDWGGKR